MKKLFSVVLFFIFSIGFISCTKEEVSETTVKPSNILDLKIVEDPSVNRDVRAKLENFNLRTAAGVSFDYNTLFEARLDENSPKAYVYNQIGFNEMNAINYGVALGVKDNNDLSDPIITKTERVGNGLFQISYYDTDGNLIAAVEVDSINETLNVAQVGGNWGQNTMDCINDVYSNHGWVSVWAFVQSAFIPATAGAFAAACAIKNW
jgi:hypothetical protein